MHLQRPLPQMEFAITLRVDARLSTLDLVFPPATRQAPSNSLFGNWSAFSKRAMCGPQVLFCHQEHRRPFEQQNEAADVVGVAGPHLCADRTPVQLEANKLENFGEGRPSETASFDAVLQDDAALNISHSSVQCAAITQFMPTQTAQSGAQAISAGFPDF